MRTDRSRLLSVAALLAAGALGACDDSRSGAADGTGAGDATAADAAVDAGADAAAASDVDDATSDPVDADDATVVEDSSDAAVESDAGDADDAIDPDGADAASDADATADADVEPPWTPPFPPITCGSAPYAWLPPAAVGDVVTFDEEPLLSNLDAAAVDAILAQVGYTGFSPVPYGVRNFYLRYTTQDRGVVREATAVVGIPLGIDLSEPVPLAIWLHPTTGFIDACAPSGESHEGVGASSLLASLGFVTVAPDFLGMVGFGEPSPPGTLHPYLVPEPTALASLDAVAAARKALATLGDSPTADLSRVVLIGASQGGQAAFWVDRYAPHYAPELHIIAAATAVPPTDGLGQGVWAVTHFGETTLAFAGAITAARAWYGAPADLVGVLASGPPLDPAHTLPGILGASCRPDVDLGAIGGIEDVFDPTFAAGLAAGDLQAVAPWGCYLAEGSVDRSSVPRANDTPFFVSFGERDELVTTSVELAAVERLCAQGYAIVSLECAGKGHVSGASASLPALFAFIEDRLAGVPMDPAAVCHAAGPVECAAP